MAYSSGCHFDFEMTIGWGCHPFLISKFLIHQIEKLFCSSSTIPKPQINYSNQQYHLLIANKHQKLLTYCLFEGLINWKQMKLKWNPDGISSGSYFILKWQPDDILIRLLNFLKVTSGWNAIRFSFFWHYEPDGCGFYIGVFMELKNLY